MRLWLCGMAVCVMLAAAAERAVAQVENTAHDLSVPETAGSASSENRCSFCHTPHDPSPSRALWGSMPQGVSYTLYESSTLNATLDQPTGASRVCLSCHDGTIALSERMGRTLDATGGGTSLGTDLSDDHPISFTYDGRLSALNRELTDPSLLPSTTRLDPTKQLQCTTCHDPHESRLPKFLVTDNRASRLCLACHQPAGWTMSAHATSSGAGDGAAAGSDGVSGTVAENGCANCHRVHSAARPQWLLRSANEANNCLVCHGGTAAAKNVERELRKFSSHPVEQPDWVHTPGEDPRSMPRHVACSDCHNPHATQRSGAGAASLGSIRGVKGVNASGVAVAQASAEYELCYACHGLREPARSAVIRLEPVANTRQEFDPGNASFHPVVAPSRSPGTTGLEPGYSAPSTIKCSDCHGSDNPNGAQGPHGSVYEPILEREYSLQDPSPESYQAYSLCYKCHARSSVLSDRGGFPHRKHVVDLQAPCATCHDAHGSRNNAHLINFAIRGRTGTTLVTPSRTGRLAFQSLGPSQGQCFLSCHGSDHDGTRYPAPFGT